MLNFTHIQGPAGIPVYFQRMPDAVRSVSVTLVVFTGAGDDRTIGLPGLHHWFEHVPGRGTLKYPNGTADFHQVLGRFGGSMNAGTGKNATQYSAFGPLFTWKDCLSIVVDLFAQPLITTEGVDAEREIIYQEMRMYAGDAESVYQDGFFRTVFAGHVFADTVLGSRETLGQMDADTLRTAHRLGYDRSRIALFIAGNIDSQDIYAELEKLVDVMPANGVSARSAPIKYGETHWPTTAAGMIHMEQTSFDPSMTMMTFAFPRQTADANSRLNQLVNGLFCFGSLASPLERVVREERKLVYSVDVLGAIYEDAATISFQAMSERKNIGKIQRAYLDVIASDHVWSKCRAEEVCDALRYEPDMLPISPDLFVDQAVTRFLTSGRLVNDAERIQMWEMITQAELDELRSIFDPMRARRIIFQGKE